MKISSEVEKIDKTKEKIDNSKKKEEILNKVKETITKILKLIRENKIITILVSIILGVFFISASIASSLNGEDKLIYNFNKAIINKDINKIKKYMICSDYSLKIEYEKAKEFLGYIDEHPFYHKSIVDSLYKQKRNIKDGKDCTFSIKKKGKSMFLFDKYFIEVKPHFIEINTDYKDTTIYVDGEKVGVSDKDKFCKEYGPFIPGIHEIKTIYKYKNIYTKKIEKLNGYTVYDDKLYVNISPNIEYINVYSNVKNVELYINRKNTGLVISKSLEYGPVPLDGSVKIYVAKKYSNGIKKSKEMNIKSSNIYLPIK